MPLLNDHYLKGLRLCYIRSDLALNRNTSARKDLYNNECLMRELAKLAKSEGFKKLI